MHYIAVSFCLGGISVLVLSDILNHKNGADTDSWNASALYGDFLCLLGSAVYACSNVGQEYLVKKRNRRVSGRLGRRRWTIDGVGAHCCCADVVRRSFSA